MFEKSAFHPGDRGEHDTISVQCGHEEHILGQGGASACARSTARAARVLPLKSPSASRPIGQADVVADPEGRAAEITGPIGRRLRSNRGVRQGHDSKFPKCVSRTPSGRADEHQIDSGSANGGEHRHDRAFRAGQVKEVKGQRIVSYGPRLRTPPLLERVQALHHLN